MVDRIQYPGLTRPVPVPGEEAEVPHLDAFWRQPSEPRRSRRPTVRQGMSVLVLEPTQQPEAVTVDRWWVRAELPVRTRPRPVDEGFATKLWPVNGGALTVYSGTPDGYVQSIADTWADVYDNSGTAVVSAHDDEPNIYVGAAPTETYQGFIDFDLSALPSGLPVSAAALSVRTPEGGGVFDRPGTIEVRVYDWGETLTDADFREGNVLAALPLVATLDSDDVVNDAFNLFVEEGSAFQDAVEAAAGGSLRLILNWSAYRENDEPADYEYLQFYSSDEGPGFKPQLVVTYGSPDFGEVITLDKWWVEPGRTRTRKRVTPSLFAQNIDPIADVAPEDITVDKWFRLTEFPRLRPWRPMAGMFTAESQDAEAVGLDKWFIPSEIPVLERRLRDYTQYALQITDYAEAVSLDKWFVESEMPRWRERVAEWLIGQNIEPLPDTVAVTIEWFLQGVFPVTREVRPHFASFIYPESQAAEAVSLDKWWIPTEIPRLPLWRPEGLHVLQITDFPEVTTLDKWWMRAELPVILPRFLDYGRLSVLQMSSWEATIPPTPTTHQLLNPGAGRFFELRPGTGRLPSTRPGAGRNDILNPGAGS